MPRANSRLGKPNKRTTARQLAVQALCDKYHFDPLEAMIVMVRDTTLDDALRVALLKEITQYVRPKLRAIIVQGDEQHPLVWMQTVKTSLNEAFQLAYGDTTVNGQATPRRLPAPRP